MYGSNATKSRGLLTAADARPYPERMQYHAAQFRAARAALGLGTREVAAAAHMSFRTISEIEQPSAAKKEPSEDAVARLVEFYERQGVTFLPAAAQGVGIRIKVK
jgi:transcriptional regulator with XRE-family HTH domain